MEAVAEHELSVVLSSHLVSDLERVCDYLIVLVASRVQLAGDIDTLLATHHRLTGARRDPGTLPADQHVIAASHTDRQTTVLVRTEAPIHDPAWTVGDLGLEDLVLAYMREAHGQPRHATRAGGAPMIWLTWRQFRAAGAMMAAALAALAVILAVTGPGLADDYSTGIAACTAQGGDCSDFVDRFFQDHRNTGLAVTSVVLVLPALIGIFWGAPLIARELEAGTHRLVWNQSVTRTRWLAVKLGLVGLAAIAVAGLGSLAVDWWSDPIDKAAVAAENVSRIEPLLFGARGIAPIGYAAFAFALGVTLGMLIRRTIPAMALTLAIFVGLQVAMPELVRPHLITPTRATVEITPSNVDEFIFLGGPNGPLQVGAQAAEKGAWVLSSHTVDASGRAVDTITGHRSLSPTSGPCAPPEEPPAQQAEGPGEDLAPCLAELTRLGYRQRVTYQPASHFWPLQWRETGDLHRARPRPLRVLLLVAPPPRLLTPPQPGRPVPGRSVEDFQVDPAEALRVGDDVHLDDPPVSDREARDRERLAVSEGHRADRAVHERRAHLDVEAREGECSVRHVGRSADNPRGADRNAAAVGPEDHVTVQHLDQRLEVALACGSEERVEDLALGVEVGVGDRGLALDAAAGAAGELARRLG